jgi:hypothetical protein
MTEMAPEQPVEIEASGHVHPETGFFVSAKLPGASVELNVSIEQFENADDWAYLVQSFPQTVDAVMRALHEAKDAQDQEDIDDE